DMIGSVRAEGFPMGKVDLKACTVRIGPAASGMSRVITQVREDFPSRHTRLIACWRHVHNLPVDQFSLALHFVKIVYCGACFDTHNDSSSPVLALLYRLRWCRACRRSPACFTTRCCA